MTETVNECSGTNQVISGECKAVEIQSEPGKSDGLLEKIKEVNGLTGGVIESYSPLSLAYIGDSIYALVAKTIVVERGNCPARELHSKTVNYVSAVSQAKIVRYLTEENLLSDKEADVLRRGRNAKSSSVAKNASVIDYRLATGLEALVGYLYLTNNGDRMLEILKIGFDMLDLEKAK